MQLHGFPEGQAFLLAGAVHHLAYGLQHGRVQQNPFAIHPEQPLFLLGQPQEFRFA
ncbi:hypothetical protein D3C81_2233190 [compost metagenome]